MYCGAGFRPHTVQRVALGASRDGRLSAIIHDAYQETSSYEEYAEALLNATRFLHSCPNVYTRHRIARMNVQASVDDFPARAACPVPVAGRHPH